MRMRDGRVLMEKMRYRTIYVEKSSWLIALYLKAKVNVHGTRTGLSFALVYFQQRTRWFLRLLLAHLQTHVSGEILCISFMSDVLRRRGKARKIQGGSPSYVCQSCASCPERNCLSQPPYHGDNGRRETGWFARLTRSSAN